MFGGRVPGIGGGVGAEVGPQNPHVFWQYFLMWELVLQNLVNRLQLDALSLHADANATRAKAKANNNFILIDRPAQANPD